MAREEHRALDLGWRGTTILPAKRKEIEGVGVSSIMGLQAQLYQAQEGAKTAAVDGDTGRIQGKRGKVEVKGFKGVMNRKNAGIQERNKKDADNYPKTEEEREVLRQQAMARKAEEYESYKRGDKWDDDEQFLTDFARKGEWRSQAPRRASPSYEDMQQQAAGQSHDRQGAAGSYDDGGPSTSGQQGRGTDRGSGFLTHEEQLEAELRRQHKERVMEVAAQTREQREQAAERKQRQEQEDANKLDKLKKDFLERQKSQLKLKKTKKKVQPPTLTQLP